jgi:hypothetical protein
MTAEDFAMLLKAQRAGARRWRANCPAHADRSPSLSIREGDDGRVLLHCFAGCGLDEVLATLGLFRRDLFAGPPPSPEQITSMRAAREAREREECTRRQAQRNARDGAKKWEAAVNALGARLAQTQDNDQLARLFHVACGRLHEAQMKAEELSDLAHTGLSRRGRGLIRVDGDSDFTI